ncbi:hypothetical protein PFISCL1PPCAC_24078, partial [Pristionchus fissidentatus]
FSTDGRLSSLVPTMSGTKNEKKTDDKKKKKSPARRKGSTKRKGDEFEKTMGKCMRKLQELPEDSFVVETIPVTLQTYHESKIKLTYENIVTEAPTCAITTIDLGDQILAINGRKVTNREDSRNVFRDLKRDVLRDSGGKKIDFEVQITRRRLKRLKLSQMPRTMASEDLPKGYDYYEATMVLFPNSNIGFNVKPLINMRCMVSSVDGGWKSVAKKIFMVGDILLYIAGKEGQEVNSIATAREALQKYAKNSVIRIWFARAKNPICIKLVRAALVQDKAPPQANDPRMTADCLDIVKNEIEAMDYRKNKNMFVPEVVKDWDENEKRRIDFRKVSKFARIGVEENVNLHHLSSVPPREKKKPAVAGAAPAASPTPPTPPIPPPPIMSPPTTKKKEKKKKPGKTNSRDSKDSKEEKGSAEKEGVADPAKKRSASLEEDNKNVKSNYLCEDMNKANGIAAFGMDNSNVPEGQDGSKRDSSEVAIDSSKDSEKPKN